MLDYSLKGAVGLACVTKLLWHDTFSPEKSLLVLSGIMFLLSPQGT